MGWAGPLIRQDLRSGWGSQLYCVDASERGLGVCAAEATVDECQKLGRYNERWRYRSKTTCNARSYVIEEQAEANLGILQHGDPLADDGDIANGKSFVQVPFSSVNRSWLMVGRHRWNYEESIPVYEARAILHAVRHIMRHVHNFGCRHVILSDSMTAILCFSKGRAHAHRLRRVVQQVSAYLLATGSNLVVRWIPSEWNASPRRLEC